jgi:hypothetical protein
MSAEPQIPANIASRSDFIATAHGLLARLDAASAREITLVDIDFSPWPLDDIAVVDALTRWIRLPGRRLRLLGARFDVIQREQPRFAAWRQPYAHAVECMTPSELDPSDVPGLLWLGMGSGCLELLERERWQARWITGRSLLVLQQERIDALVQRCEPAWPVTVLGL